MPIRIDFQALDLRSTLDFAIGMEEDEQLRYRELSACVADPGAAALFRAMVDQEATHRRRLESRRDVLFRHAPPRFDTSLGDRVAELETPSVSAREALEESLHAERRVWRFYSEALGHVQDEDVRASFHELRQESAAHHALLRSRLADLPPSDPPPE